MPISIHRTTSPVALGGALLRLLDRVPEDPFAPETVAVGHPGLARWIRQQVATRRGVCAHLETVLLGPWVDGLAVDAAATTWQPAGLAVHILRRLPSLLSRPDFAPIRAYLADRQDEPPDEAAVRRHQLAGVLASTFRRYLDWRPDMLAAWSRGEDLPTGSDAWQPALWAALATEGDPVAHRDAVVRTVAGWSPDERRARAGVGERLVIYAPPRLRPHDLAVLGALAAGGVDLHLLCIAPPVDAEPAPGSLAGSLGTGPRGRLDAMRRAWPDARLHDHDAGTAPGLLGHLQQAAVGPAGPLPEIDDSLRLHACHSPMREVEVLHDQLLALFDQDDAPAPQDVVVLAPDIDRYAPFVEAVFQGGAMTDKVAGAEPRIPFTIGDIPRRRLSPAADAMQLALDLADTRMPASMVLDLLAVPCVLERYGLSADDLDAVKGLVGHSGARWGLDLDHQRDEDLAVLGGSFTWRFGTDRLMLGLAMADEGALFHGMRPLDTIEGDLADVAGRVSAFVDAVLPRLRALSDPPDTPADARGHSWEEWAAQLTELLGWLSPVGGDHAGSRAFVRRCIEALVAPHLDEAAADPDERVPLPVVREQLSALLDEERRDRAFRSRGVSFGQLSTGRPVPARVVVLLGMDDGAFPRSASRPAFDRMAAAPRPDDPQPRVEDRAALLEAVLGARDALWISYVGQSQQKQQEQPPSVAVQELLDAACAGLSGKDRARRVDRLRTRHPLHAHSLRYFGADPTLHTYSRGAALAARASVADPGAVPSFLDGELPPPPRDETRQLVVTLDELGRFLAHPVKHLLRQRLGLWLEQGGDAVQDREPLALDHLQTYLVRDQVLSVLEQGGDPAALLAREQAAGAMVPGVPGARLFDGLVQESRAFADSLVAARGTEPLPPLPVDVELGDCRLVGTVDELGRQGRVVGRYASLKLKDLMSAWVHHLALCAAAGASADHAELPRQTHLLSKGAKGAVAQLTLGPVDDPEAQLQALIDLWQQGAKAPARLFPRGAMAWLAKTWKPGRTSADELPQAALARAQGAWTSTKWSTGDDDDAWLTAVFPDAATAHSGGGELSFSSLAERVLSPIAAATRS